MYILPYHIIIMNFFKTEEQKTRKNINKILEICDLQRLKKIEQVLLTGVVQIDSLEVQEKPQIKYKTVESDEVTETTKETVTEKIIAKTAEIIDYTYYTNDKKLHGVIAITAKKLGIGKLEFPQSKFGKLDYYLKFEGNTNQANKLMVENWDSFKNYIHRSERKNTKKVWSKQ